MTADARDELIELLHKARIKTLAEPYDVQDAAGVDAILANPVVVARALIAVAGPLRLHWRHIAWWKWDINRHEQATNKTRT